jgi:hypothetical protein
MPYPMKRKTIPEEVIRKVIDEAHSEGWELKSVIARTRLTEKIWENILSNFPEIRLASEIVKKYYDEWDEKPTVTQEEYLEGICAECD